MINLSIQNIIPFFVQHLFSSSLRSLKEKGETVTGQDPSYPHILYFSSSLKYLGNIISDVHFPELFYRC